jgi:predicted alpha/beta-hydrolase family hydrolase
MQIRPLKINVSDSIGEVTAELTTPDKPTCIMTFAHGAGANMHHQFMKDLSNALAEHNIATLRFNFPYMEKKSNRPDPAPIAEKTVAKGIEKAGELFPHLPIVVAGKSFGGRMSSQLLSKHTFTAVKAMIFYGFPLHAPGKPGTDRAKHLIDIRIPMLFLQGTKDQLAQEKLIRDVCNDLPTSTLAFIDKADHSFKVGKKDSIVDLSTKSSDWLKSINIF